MAAAPPDTSAAASSSSAGGGPASASASGSRSGEPVVLSQRARVLLIMFSGVMVAVLAFGILGLGCLMGSAEVPPRPVGEDSLPVCKVWDRLVKINHMLLPAAVNIPFVFLIYIYVQLYSKSSALNKAEEAKKKR